MISQDELRRLRGLEQRWHKVHRDEPDEIRHLNALMSEEVPALLDEIERLQKIEAAAIKWKHADECDCIDLMCFHTELAEEELCNSLLPASPAASKPTESRRCRVCGGPVPSPFNYCPMGSAGSECVASPETGSGETKGVENG